MRVVATDIFACCCNPSPTFIDLAVTSDFQLINRGVHVAKAGVFQAPDRNCSVLVLNLAHMGDLVLSAPAILRLKEKIRNCDIDIVVGDYNVELARSLGVFRNVYAYNFFQPKSSVDPARQLREENTLLQALPAYDIAIDLRRPPDTRFLLIKVNAKIKAGFTTFSPSDDELDVCLPTDDVNYEFGKAKEHNLSSISLQLLELVDALPVESISLPVTRKRVASGNALAIFPFAGQELKEWPTHNFVEISRRVLTEKLFTKVNVYVSAREMERTRGWNEMPGVEMRSGLSVPELMDSLPANRVVVANNSFGAHLASLLTIPLIGIYSGHETWIEWQPVFGESKILYSDLSCSPCHIGDAAQCPFDLLCLRQITVDHVMELLKAEPKRRAEEQAHSFSYVPPVK
jgi:ADP-heptose:LPS heptosyltransferase